MHFSDTFDTSVSIADADCVPLAAVFGFTVGTVVAAAAVVVAPAAVVVVVAPAVVVVVDGAALLFDTVL